MTHTMADVSKSVTFTAHELRGVFGTFPTGVVAVAGTVDGVRVGVAASSFTSVSLDPPLVSVAFDNTSTTWPVLRKSARLGISVLAEGQDLLCRQLAAKNADRFANASTTISDGGAVLFHGAVSWLEVELHDELQGGDHSIALLAVKAMHTFTGTHPLVFHGSGFRALAA